MEPNLKKSVERFESHRLETEPYRVTPIREPNQQALYDTLRLNSRVSRYMVFQSPVGSSAQGRVKSLQDTNMWESGMLPAPWAFYFKSLSSVFVKGGRVLPIRNVWYRGTHATLVVNSKIYLQTSLDRAADRCALFVDDEDRKDAITRGIWKLLEPVPWIPVLIDVQQSFTVNLDFSDLLDWDHAPDELVVYLDGVVFRSVI